MDRNKHFNHNSSNKKLYNYEENMKDVKLKG